MTQAVEMDAVPVVGVGNVWHRVTRVPAAPALTRVQALAGAVSPKLHGAAIIENIRVKWIQPALEMACCYNCVSNATIPCVIQQMRFISISCGI